MEDKQIVLTLELNIDQINVILATMGKLPYESIAPLMNSIQSQATAQLQKMQAAQKQSQVPDNSAPATVQ